MNRLFLIDGHALIFRMYYAFLRRPMINSKGEDTSILFGFTKFLLELIRREQPTHLAVMFDPHAKTFRHELCPDYKANRAAAPELVHAALEPLQQIVGALNIPVLMKPGFEADDVIGSVATREALHGFDVYMVTPDKDLGQIIDDHIYQYKPGKSGSDSEVYDKARLCETYGISDPKHIIDILTLWGDASDNIKGVPGVGEIGARKLVGKYGTVENIYAHIGELTPRLQESLRSAEPYIRLSKKLATIRTDVELDYKEQDLRLRASYSPAVADLFNYYEFNSLKGLLPTAEGFTPPELEPQKEALSCVELSPEAMAAAVREAGRCAISARKRSLAFEPLQVAVGCGSNYTVFDAESLEFRRLMADPAIIKCGFDLKRTLLLFLENHVEWAGELHDVELMHYLLNPERPHKLEILAGSYLNVDLEAASAPAAEAPAQPAPQLDLFSAPVEAPASAPAEDPLRLPREVVALYALAPLLRIELREQNLWDLYTRVEMPLIEVLSDMEHTGVRVDPQPLKEYSVQLGVELAQIEAQAREVSGEPALNLASPRQVGQVIFEKLALDPKIKKGRRGDYPTDEETLSDLKDRHPFVGLVLEYRALRKLISTYLDPLPALINPRTGRIHTTFNQALTATGRLSSVKPNLQNIPIRTARGREIRKAFVSGSPDGFIVSADYSQIELRLMAELSGDPALVEGFNHGADIHADTASRIFRVPLSEVTPEQRRQAKVANFGIIYGISAFGLAQRMEIPRSEAKVFIEQYFTHYPKVRAYMDRVVEEARSKGYVETLFGRKRFLPDLASKNPAVRALAERNAINAPIQGTAADIIKKAMISVYRGLKERGLRSKMVLQVHDELVLDVAADELPAVMELVKQEMEAVCSLSIPLTAECNYGKNWLEAH